MESLARTAGGSGWSAAGRARALAAVVLLLLPAPLSAQSSAPLPNADEAQAAVGQLRSPYCPGLMLEVCPSPQAAALRDSIRVMAAEGRSAGEIVESVIARHGEEWRAVPKKSGLGLWAWLLPPLVLLAGAWFITARLRRGRAARAPESAPVEELSGAERERLAVALRRWEKEEVES